MKYQDSENNHCPSGPPFADIIEFLPDPVFAIDRQGNVIAWNRAITELTGVRAADMIGKGNHEYSIPFWGIRRPVLIDLVQNWDEDTANLYNYVRQEGENLVAEVQNPPFKPGPTLFWNSARKLYDSNGDCIGAIEVIRDITHLKQTDTALQHRLVFEELVTGLSTEFARIESGQLDDAVYGALAEVGRFTGVDHSYLFQFSDDLVRADGTHEWCANGISPGLQNLQNILCASFPWWMQKLHAGENIIIQSVAGLPMEAQAEKQFFQARNIRSLLAVPIYCGHRIFGFLGFDSVRTEKEWIHEDIQLLRTVSEIIGIAKMRQMNEKALRQSEARLRTLLDNLPFDCWATDAEGRYTVQNSVSKRRWGNQLGKTLPEADIPQDVKELWIIDNQIALTGKIFSAEVEYTHKGQSGIYQKILAPIWAEDKIIGTLGVDIDITERKIAEQKLQESEQRLSAIFARAAVGLCEISPEGKFIKVNAELCRILDRTSDQLLNMSVSDVTHPDDLHHSIAAFERLWKKGEPASLDKRYLRPDGTVVFANSALTRINGKQGHPQAILAVTVDTTEQVKAKEVLEQRVAERTAELDNRNKEIMDLAHKTIQTLENDRRNLSKELHDSIGGTLAAIMYQLEARVEQMGKPPETVRMPLERIIEYLSEAITESRRITKQLRPSVLDDFGLTAAFEEYIEDFQTFHPEIKLILQVSMLEEKISSDAKTVLYRVLQEALNNVGKYSKADSVEIKCQCREDRIRLQIKDNGIGFNVSEAFGGARVMEGYGLNSMRERIEICQGKFHIESAPGQGTTVIAELPYECHATEF